MFTGFSEDTRDFLWGLALHNERPWFQEHREDFLRHLKQPMDELAADTFALMTQRWPQAGLKLHVARIYRDARRLGGHGPYKDHLWFSVKDWDGLLQGPMFWFELGAADWSWGMGYYSASAAQMEAYRRCIDADPGYMSRLAEGVLAQTEFRLGGADYARPKGERGALLNPWYNKKWVGLESTHDFSPALYDPALPQRLAEGYAFLWPYYEFLRRFADVAPGT